MVSIAQEDLALLGDAADRFARSVVAPVVATLDGGAELDRVLARADELGFSTLDEEPSALSIVLRRIARESAGVACALAVHAFARRLLRSARPDAVGADERLAYPAFAPIHARRALVLDASRLSGSLSLVPLAKRAHRLVIPMRDGAGTQLVSCAVDAPGLVAVEVAVLGLGCCAPHDLRLDDVEATVLGPVDDAAIEELERHLAVALAAVALGLSEGSHATALEYARQRRQGGRPIVEWPEVARLLANMRDTTSVLDAALSRGHDIDSARALASEAVERACAVTSDGVQLLGGNGYTKDYPQERRMRDARQLRCLLPSQVNHQLVHAVAVHAAHSEAELAGGV